MFVFKKLILICFLLLICSCSFNGFKKLRNSNFTSVEIYTPNDKYNTYFKENLKRLFTYNSNKTKKYLLITNITFNSSNTLSLGGSNTLKSTKATIYYHLKDNKTKNILKSGSIVTFPALSSSSRSLYTQEKSIDHIKKRLTKSSAKSLHMKLNLFMRRLS
tara:strand:- start:139 stop:621 length:483 start_codon:yes stop_codon:yes gene_type:complete